MILSAARCEQTRTNPESRTGAGWMSLRYLAGYSLIWVSRLLRRVLQVMWRVAVFPERFALVVWTPREIDRYSRAAWNSLESVREYSEPARWLHTTEKSLVEKYLMKEGNVLNLACGAGREALLLAKLGFRVTACDWSPRMIAAAQRQAQEADLTIRFEVADMYDLQFPENAFDYVLVTNVAYSCLGPRRRRVRFLRQACLFLKPGGLFILSFVRAPVGSPSHKGFVQSLLTVVSRYAPFNREYEPGDFMISEFTHAFEPDALKDEFEEAQFIIKEWLWNEGHAVLAKA